MAVESWISPEETPALAAAATAMIEDRLSRFPKPERDAYWASIRKAYNTPYNPPPSRRTAKVSPLAVPARAMPPIEIQASALAGSALAGSALAASALAASTMPAEVQTV